jgi:toxin-antitoxin system PIN domain toxin
MRLLDVNVLLANSLESHVHHQSVVRWFQRNGDMPFATCALTETSLLRLLMNPAINDEPIDAATGIELLRRLHRHPRHRFIEKLPSPGGPEAARFLQPVQGYRQVTDATLVAIAQANGGKLATFDQKLADLFGPDVLEVIAGAGPV